MQKVLTYGFFSKKKRQEKTLNTHRDGGWQLKLLGPLLLPLVGFQRRVLSVLEQVFERELEGRITLIDKQPCERSRETSRERERGRKKDLLVHVWRDRIGINPRGVLPDIRTKWRRMQGGASGVNVHGFCARSYLEKEPPAVVRKDPGEQVNARQVLRVWNIKEKEESAAVLSLCWPAANAAALLSAKQANYAVILANTTQPASCKMTLNGDKTLQRKRLDLFART